MDDRGHTLAVRIERSVALRVTLGVLGFGIFGWTVALAAEDGVFNPLSLWACSLLASGLIAWSARPQHRAGLMLVLAGLATAFLSGWWQEDSAALFTVSRLLSQAAVAVLVHLAVAFPTGRLRARRDRLVVAAVYAWCLPLIWVGGLIRDARELGCERCEPGSGIELFDASEGLFGSYLTIRNVTAVVLAVAVTMLLARRYRAGSPPAKRVLRPVVGMGAAVAAVGLLNRAMVLLLDSDPVALARDWADAGFTVGLILVPFGFLAGIVRTRVTRSTLGELVVELGRWPGAEGVRAALARALGDASVSVGYWARELRAYVDGDGHPLGPADPGQHETVVEREGEPLAVLRHDPALLLDEGLVESVAAAAKLALENERLKAELRAQLTAVADSRARLVAAADAERRRIERDLHLGAEQRLAALILAVDVAQDRAGGHGATDAAVLLGRAGDEARAALEELRDLARGVHPEVLAQDGLRAALAVLAERCPVPVDVEAPEARLPEAAEGCAYFVCSEALANVAKYAQASRVEVRARAVNGDLHVDLADDGVGGAHLQPGSGLTGLRDRVEATGGTLELDSPPGAGTRLSAVIPLG